MLIRTTTECMVMIAAGFLFGQVAQAEDAETWDGKIVQYGKMHEAIGQRRDEGRVQLKELVGRPHFYGVAALEKLAGEVTIYDGKITTTVVNAEGQATAREDSVRNEKATMLVGAYVPRWTERKVSSKVSTDEFDRYVAESAKAAGVDASAPFVFTAEGEFTDLRLHVINGACPMHARLKKIELPIDNKPFELELDKVRGTLVGVYAEDAVGNITHPATATHMHLVFEDAKSKKRITGHVERIGLLEGTVLRLPKTK